MELCEHSGVFHYLVGSKHAVEVLPSISLLPTLYIADFSRENVIAVTDNLIDGSLGEVYCNEEVI